MFNIYSHLLLIRIIYQINQKFDAIRVVHELDNPEQDRDIYNIIPQPIRNDGAEGYNTGPRNIMQDFENPDLLIPPKTDAGLLPIMKFSFSDTAMKLNFGGWSLEITVLLKLNRGR